MDKIKLTRPVTSRSAGVALTDELYGKLSASQQLIAAIGEAVGVDVVIAEYEGRNYVATSTVLAIAAKFSA